MDYSGRPCQVTRLACAGRRGSGRSHGPNQELYRDIVGRYPDLSVQASGGVSGLRDLEQLSQTGVDAAITGKALLEGCFSVSEAIEVLA